MYNPIKLASKNIHRQKSIISFTLYDIWQKDRCFIIRRSVNGPTGRKPAPVEKKEDFKIWKINIFENLVEKILGFLWQRKKQDKKWIDQKTEFHIEFFGIIVQLIKLWMGNTKIYTSRLWYLRSERTTE